MKKYRKIAFIVIIILGLTLLPIFKGKNIYGLIATSINNPIKKLSASRQAVYDKMKVVSLNIKERKTGTAPFNEATISDANGADINDSDDYIRTFDKMTYIVEVGIGPNTSVEGVDNTSIFKGGAIKVKAKLPNQGDETIMRWVKDAWMNNVEFSNDNTEIYAEYIISDDESVTNAIQNLSFTVQVDGYKKEVTNSMKPTFEIWMEGNKPDDSSSSAEALTTKDNNNIIISGHPSYDAEIITSSLSIKEHKNDVYGQYDSFAVGFALKQDVLGFEDLRGIEYPTGKMTTDIVLNYSYKTNNTYTELTDGNINGAEIIAYNPNQFEETYGKIYPENVTRLNCPSLPFGKKGIGSDNKSVVDTGTITANLTGNKILLSIENYKLNGTFPTISSTAAKEYDKKTGYFAAVNMQLFIPFYVDNDSNTHDAKMDLKLSNLKYSTLENSNISTGADSNNIAQDTITSNNTATIVLNQKIEAYVGLFFFSNIDSSYSKPDAYVYDGREFMTAFQTDNGSDTYEGGSDNLIVWNPNKQELLPYSEDKYYHLNSSYSMIGLPRYSLDGMKEYFGVYKKDKINGPQTLKEINSAVYDDFDWYETYTEAKSNGSVSGYYLVFPENKGRNYRYVIYNKFKAKVSEEDYGKTTTMRAKAKIYLDKDKTQAFSSLGYLSEGIFSPTEYDNNGLLNYGENLSQGETLLMIQAAANSTTSVSDKDSSNKPKKSYDVQEEINFVITPELTNGKQPSNEDAKMNDVYVRTKLPAGLNYKEGSANKEPTSVTLNSDGTTDIEWKYDNWQINHDAPEYKAITFKAEISASIENNKELEIKTTTSAPYDVRDVDVYRTSSYKISATNLLGIQAIKETNKNIIDLNESFIVTSTIGNNSEESLSNIKGIEFLPGKDNSNESIIDGTYTITIKELSQNQKLYYTTKDRESLNIEKDIYGKDLIKNIDLDSDNNWIELTTGETLPSNATAIATSISTISPSSNVRFKYEVVPQNNKSKNIYAFVMDIATNNTSIAVSSNMVVTKVVNRQINGIYFEDVNRNNVYDKDDILLSNKTVRIFDTSGNKIAETKTNLNGKYIFDSLSNNKYIIEFENNGNNYEVVPAGTTENSSYANSEFKTAYIDQTIPSNGENYIINNINIGVRKKEAKVIVSHIFQDINQTFKTETIDKYFGDEYTTSATTQIPDNYEYSSTTGISSGVANASEIVVKYYYKKKESKISINLETTGTEKITSKDEIVNYTIKSNGTIKDYIGTETIVLTSTLPYEIDTSKSNLDGGTYDNNTKTITWTSTKDENTFDNGNTDINIEKNIKVVFKNIESATREFNNNVNIKVLLDNNQEVKTAVVKTLVEIKGTIKVLYYEKDKDGNNKEINKPDEITGLIGSETEILEKQIKGFEILEKPEKISYTYLENEQKVIFIYKRQKYKITVKTTNGEGTVDNEEQTIEYGDDPRTIVVKSPPEKCIDTITINGKENKLPSCETKYELKLENVDESKNILVSFAKIQTNPETKDRIIQFIILGSVSLLALILIFILKKKHKK